MVNHCLKICSLSQITHKNEKFALLSDLALKIAVFVPISTIL